MFKAYKKGDLIMYAGHVIAPWRQCEGTVEIWDQTVGCPECQQELWTGKTSEDEFNTIHLWQFTDCHDHGDEDARAWRYDESGPPVGGWRSPSEVPAFHPGSYWGKYVEDRRKR